MPHFQQVPLQEAMQQGIPSKRQQLLQGYIAYIEQLENGNAGRLVPSDGETPMVVRRRLTAASKLAGKELQVRRTGDEIYFWLKGPQRRRGRPRKTT